MITILENIVIYLPIIISVISFIIAIRSNRRSNRLEKADICSRIQLSNGLNYSNYDNKNGFKFTGLIENKGSHTIKIESIKIEIGDFKQESKIEFGQIGSYPAFLEPGESRELLVVRNGEEINKIKKKLDIEELLIRLRFTIINYLEDKEEIIRYIGGYTKEGYSILCVGGDALT